jgi:hypothetical protein
MMLLLRVRATGCGAMLSAMGVGGTEGMTSFYDSCLGTLYPPGQCAEECTPSMMHCRLMEVQAACCGDPANCPDGDPVPHSCPVECALVFPFFLESCHDALEAQGGEMRLYERFSQACTRQDTTALVEYASDLIDQGCTVDLGGLRRLAEPEPDQHMEKVVQLQSPVNPIADADDSRRLQAVGTGACEGFMDDPSGDLAAHGVSCDQVLALGCDTDLSGIQPTMPRGSLVSFSCPVSCEECHRKGMARWIETPNDCVWDNFDDRLNEVNEVCCAADGADPDATCPRGGPPRACSPLCAVTFHSLTVDCGDKLLSLAGERQAAGFTAFDGLCTSERSVDPMVFLDAIATATCERFGIASFSVCIVNVLSIQHLRRGGVVAGCSSTNCNGCSDEVGCNTASLDGYSSDQDMVCEWDPSGICTSVPARLPCTYSQTWEDTNPGGCPAGSGTALSRVASSCPANGGCHEFWAMACPPGQRAHLHFTSFHLHGNGNCHYDTVAVMDGDGPFYSCGYGNPYRGHPVDGQCWNTDGGRGGNGDQGTSDDVIPPTGSGDVLLRHCGLAVPADVTAVGRFMRLQFDTFDGCCTEGGSFAAEFSCV